MRCGHFDVLIFPVEHAGRESHHTIPPVQEFLIKCFQLKDSKYVIPGAEHDSIPLMTCSIPTFDPETPFVISVHSWVPEPPFDFEVDEAKSKQVWQIRVTVDGNVKYTGESSSADAKWPSVIRDLTTFKPPRQNEVLRFPKFDPGVAAFFVRPDDNRGRIKIEILEGHYDKKASDGNFGTEFHTLACHAIFSYSYAPIETLKDDGIAWPGQRDEVLYELQQGRADGITPPYQSSGYQYGGLPVTVRSRGHRRQVSVRLDENSCLSSSPMFSGASGALPPTPGTFPSIPPSQLPFFSGPSRLPPLSGPFDYQPPTNYVPSFNVPPFNYVPPLSFTKTSEAPAGPPHPKMQEVLEMLKDTKFKDNTMAPPPISQRATGAGDAKVVNGTEPDDSMNAVDRRGMNRSDISMHASCPDFPNCIDEEDDRLVHRPRGRTAHADENNNDIHIKKEGGRNMVPNGLQLLSDAAASVPSSSTPPRDPRQPSYSPISPVNDQPGQKRDRVSLLTVNKDGSPEKLDKRRRVMVAPQDL